MKVWIVMANDYPDAVFELEKDAQIYCVEQKRKREEYITQNGGSSIYYRSYPFDIVKAAPFPPDTAP